MILNVLFSNLFSVKTFSIKDKFTDFKEGIKSVKIREVATAVKKRNIIP